MAKKAKCSSCGATVAGAGFSMAKTAYQCTNCGYMYCYSCGKDKCPRCGGKTRRWAG